MAVSVASFSQCANFVANSPNTATASWSAGDYIIVGGTAPDDTDNFNTPTATGLTFTQQVLMDINSSTQSKAGIWTAQAGSAGSGVTITLSATLTTSLGLGVWVVSGVSSFTPIAGDQNEIAYSNITVVDGAAVFVVMIDFNDAATARSPTTGSGTATERVDIHGIGAGQWFADWVGCTAGTFTFGNTDYTGARSTQVGLIANPVAATLSQFAYRFGLDDNTESAHTFAAAENTTVNLAVNDNRLLRVQVDETAGAATTLTRPTWQYRQVGDPASEWRNVNP